jgi:S1-C subfamily serine protease
MANKSVYQLSGRQILFLAFASALIAVGATFLFLTFGTAGHSFGQSNNAANTVLAGDAPQGITNPSAVTDEQNSIEVYKTLSPGVAFITTSARVQNYYGEESDQESGNGSGSVIDNQGHIVTNYHVVEGASKLTVSFGGDKVYPAKFVGGDPDTDLAVIKITPPAEGLTVVSLGDSDQLSVGQKVLAIGNPFGLDRTLTTGVISGLQRPIRARNGRPIDAAIQTDASINPGNSGGPLLDKFGKMIGINSQILSRSGGSVGVGFAIPVNTAKLVIPQLIQFGAVNRPKLGASLPTVSDLIERGYPLPVSKGLLVYQTIPNGSAQRAGLRGITAEGNIGDIITGVDGQKINDLDDLYRLLDKKKIGDTIQVEVYRDGKTSIVPVKLLPSAQQPTRQPQE